MATDHDDLVMAIQARAAELVELMDAAERLGIDLAQVLPGARRRPGRRTVAQVLGLEMPAASAALRRSGACYTSRNA